MRKKSSDLSDCVKLAAVGPIARTRRNSPPPTPRTLISKSQRSVLWPKLRVAPAGFGSYAKDQFPDFGIGLRPAGFAGCDLGGLRFVSVHPAEKSPRRDDRNQF